MTQGIPDSGHPLASARLKIKRANTHIQGLRNSIRRAALNPEISFTKQSELQMPSRIPGVVVEGVDVYELGVNPHVKESWGIIVGDILANMRASLDHIAWALAMKHAADRGVSLTDQEARGVTFPLYESQTRYSASSSGAQRALAHILPRARTTIEKFQPYNRPNWPQLELLAVLSELANEDKHRVVTPVLREIGVKFNIETHGVVMRLDKPDKMRFLLTDRVKAKLGDDLEPKATFDIVLHSRVMWPDYFSIFQFPLILAFIRDEVIPAFACFFE